MYNENMEELLSVSQFAIWAKNALLLITTITHFFFTF